MAGGDSWFLLLRRSGVRAGVGAEIQVSYARVYVLLAGGETGGEERDWLEVLMFLYIP